MMESRLKWYGHVLRREEEYYVGKRIHAAKFGPNFNPFIRSSATGTAMLIRTFNLHFNTFICPRLKSPWKLKFIPWNVLECPWILSRQNSSNPECSHILGVLEHMRSGSLSKFLPGQAMSGVDVVETMDHAWCLLLCPFILGLMLH